MGGLASMSALEMLSPIPAEQQATRGWRVDLNGKHIGYVESLKLSHDHFGAVEYGNTPAGYDSWCFKETGCGGSVIVPYVIIPHYRAQGGAALFIGMIQQERWNMVGGSKAWNLPRGFLDLGETHSDAAKRESGEELRFNVTERVSELPGDPVNPNSTFFVTSKAEGVHFYALRINDNEVLREGDGYIFRKDVIDPVSKTAERIFQSHFFPFQTALASPDMFTVAGAGRLLSAVRSQIY